MCHCDLGTPYNPASGPRIIDFDHFRVIGLNYIGKNENQEIKLLWDDKQGIWTRMPEMNIDKEHFGVFGICRCIPGATDGSFEYIAALSARPESPVPAGMVEADIPAGRYAVFQVESLDKIQEAWADASKWLATLTDYDVYCDGSRGICDCANHPCFEFYPEEFMKTGRLEIYFPLKNKV
jgi:predicted transcriptional regulator YdeE